MAPKFRIQRKRRPLLFHQTKRMFALGSLCTDILRMVAVYGGNLEKDHMVRVQIENRRQDTRLKAERESYVVSQSQRLELLNLEKRLQLEQKYGKERVAELLGESAGKRADDFENIPHTI
jgi:hypothetical protein